ncbi:putative kinesin light chain [Nostoc sp. NIES-3756]|uniref:tetratricopeptide repeat protein n=1 Tax=Nostoc sp. NIES-3756 TaxID=1751286 RepID=UPI0007218560|nr:tetratricopeptide repeat protein [Nostoc sp. NIES-3756]BAT55949.1 putative kinesin light chain [Nostoc sp. NIES-3756]
MADNSGKFADKVGAYVASGGYVSIGTQIIEGQKQLTPTKFIPGGSVHFVGREQELTMLHQNLQRGNYVAISGMGGVGKSELATQYARKYQDAYDGIVWLNDRSSNLGAEVLEYFASFGLEIPQELGGRLLTLKEQVAWCWSKYPNSTLPILIVFDNVTDLANLREVVPTDNRFRVLITTRLRNLDPTFIQEIPLDVLSPEKEPDKAVELLERLLGERDRRVDNQLKAANEICKYLEYLPLGIQLVGGYLVGDLQLSLEKMLKRLQARKLTEPALQDRENINSTQLGVKAAFALTWEELDSVAQQLGILLSLFSPESILWDLVVWVATGGGEKENQEAATQLNWSAEELNEAKKQLYKRNLLQQVEDGEGCYKIHALVRWFLQTQLVQSGEMKSVLEKTFASAMVTKAQTLPQSPTSKDIESIKDVIPHLEDIGNRIIAEVNQVAEEQIISPASVPNDEVIWVFVGVTRFYEGQGLYQLAELWSQECVNVCQALFSGDHLDVANSLNNLAGLYRSQGKLSQAEPLLVEALAMKKRLFVGDHPDVALSLNNLAGLYRSQGKLSQAETLYIEALARRKRLFVGDHPDVAGSLNNLAFLYYSQGKLPQAEPLYIEALAMYKRLFVGDHPNVALSLNNLAALYDSQGKLSQAEPLYIEALAMRKRLFVGDHPNVALSLNNLAGLYCSQGKLIQAEPLYIEALAMKKRLFVGDHPDVALSLNNLAGLYRSQGKLIQAEPLLVEALAIKKRLFVGDHPDVAGSLNNLAALYDSQGKLSQAKPLYIEALAMCQRLLGDEHPTTRTVRENLAILQRQLTPVPGWKRWLGQFLQ